MDQEAIQDITKIIEPYKYNIADTIKHFEVMVYDLENQKIMFLPAYKPPRGVREGSCYQLTDTAFHEIKENCPQQHVLRATGYTPHYFSKLGYDHSFLIVSEDDIMDGRVMDSREDISDLVDSLWVVDPSLKFVGPLSGSGYRIKGLYGESPRIDYTPKTLLMDEKPFALCFDSKGRLAYMRTDFSVQPFVGIGFLDRDKIYPPYGLNSDELSRIIKDEPDLRDIVINLREKQKLIAIRDIASASGTPYIVF